MAGVKEANVLVNIKELYAAKRGISFDPHVLIKTRNFINVIGSPGILHR